MGIGNSIILFIDLYFYGYSISFSNQGQICHCGSRILIHRTIYDAFVDELVKAERIELESFEQDIKTGVRAGMHTYFEGCMPVEILAYLPIVERVEIPEASHLMHVENAAAVNEAIIGFLGRRRDRPTSPPSR